MEMMGVEDCSYEVPSRTTLLTPTHHTTRLGLGTPLNYCKTAHYKPEQPLPQPPLLPPTTTTTTLTTLTLDKLSIYESPSGGGGEGTTPFPTTLQKAFAALEKRGVGGGKMEDKKGGEDKVGELIREWRLYLGWKVSLHLRWKYLEERLVGWPHPPIPPLSLPQIATLGKISLNQLRRLEISPDLIHIYHTLRTNLSHVNLPNIAKALAFSELQQGRMTMGGIYLAECVGMFPQSDLIDKRLNCIRRNEETVQLMTSPPTTQQQNHQQDYKYEIFLKQIHDTLNFNQDFYVGGGEGAAEEAFGRKLSAFNSDWNILQLTPFFHSHNRFANDLIGRRQVPHLYLTAFCNVEGLKCNYTAICKPPKVDGGCRMRYGLVEEFQGLLDKNLAISDESTIVSRKKYWEERARHNESLEGVMGGMEEWLAPWCFLLPGRIKSGCIQEEIHRDVLSHPLVVGKSPALKLLLSRLAENWSSVTSLLVRSTLDTLVASLLKLPLQDVTVLARRILSISETIPVYEPRHPTILILDQEIDILPWDWLPCLRGTDVTRMPSLNLINSSLGVSNVVKKGVFPMVVHPQSCTFLLNPDNSLPNVQKRLEGYFSDRAGWTGITARSPSTKEMETALETKDLYLYSGHGGGSNFYPEYAVQKLLCRAVPLLMGCSSAQSQLVGPRLYSNSVVNSYLIAGSPCVVGFLWEVTDIECDRFTVDLVERWLPDPNVQPPKLPYCHFIQNKNQEVWLATALRKSRDAATQFLTRSATVCYGLPIAAQPISF